MRIRWLFVLYAVIEMAVIVALVATIGFGRTVLLLAGAFVLGLLPAGSQIKRQVAVLSRGIRQPGAQVTDGVLVALGSLLMIVPGLVTSVAGLMLLLPPTRTALRPLAGTLAARTLAGRVAFNLPQGGMFMWGRLVDGADTRALLPFAIERKVTFVPGDIYYADRPDGASMRLSFATPSPAQIREGIARIGHAIERMREPGATPPPWPTPWPTPTGPR